MRIKSAYFFQFLMTGLWLFSNCHEVTPPKEEPYTSFDPKKDYFNTKASIDFAKHFSVTYHGNYKVVQTRASLNSWESGGNEEKLDIMVLVQKGTPTPELKGDLKGASIIPIPADRVAVNIENGETYISELELFHKVVAVGGAISYDDDIRQKVYDKTLAQIGYSWHQPANLELLLEKQTDLFFMNLSNLDFAGTLDKSRQLGIPTASVFEWAEKDYLGKAEWLKFYALFFNAEAKANQLFEAMKGRVSILKNIISEQPKKPSMVWGYYAGKDRWMAHTNSLEAQLLRDAGINNVLEDFSKPVRNNGEPMSSEAFLSRAYQAEHWVIGDVHAAALPNKKYLERFDSWNQGKLYHNMKRIKPQHNAFDWYGSAAVKPDLVLADLIKLVYPDKLPEHELYFMDHFDKSMKLPLEVNELLYDQ